MQAVKPHKKQLLVRLEGVDEINAAKKFIGSIVSVAESDLAPLKADEYYYYQVVGLEVFAATGARLGVITKLMSTPAGDLYVVEGGDKEHLIPVTKEIIAKIDFDARRVIIDPPEGLLEL